MVRRATRRSDGSQVAVKCLLCSPSDETRTATSQEWEVLHSLDHPAIVHPEALFENVKGMWLCMELCCCRSVDTYVNSHGALGEDAVRPLFKNLLDGLNYVHCKRIVHRDIKPAKLLLHDDRTHQHAVNVICSAPTVLKISDIHCSKRIGNGTICMLTDRSSSLFAAPELRFGSLWNERVDIWACGFSMYFMLTASFPFDSDDKIVKDALRSGKLPDVKWEGFSALAKNLVKQCLAMDMHLRPPAMELVLHPLFVAPVVAQHELPIDIQMPWEVPCAMSGQVSCEGGGMSRQVSPPGGSIYGASTVDASPPSSSVAYPYSPTYEFLPRCAETAIVCKEDMGPRTRGFGSPCGVHIGQEVKLLRRLAESKVERDFEYFSNRKQRFWTSS